mmetsp:Transcript_37056/g.106971  ORF Transcript_37056/g.106971 Transcript_37056/m.106971 type:complete len:227 (+) Transcript_37056:262-942(+)
MFRKSSSATEGIKYAKLRWSNAICSSDSAAAESSAGRGASFARMNSPVNCILSCCASVNTFTASCKPKGSLRRGCIVACTGEGKPLTSVCDSEFPSATDPAAGSGAGSPSKGGRAPCRNISWQRRTMAASMSATRSSLGISRGAMPVSCSSEATISVESECGSKSNATLNLYFPCFTTISTCTIGTLPTRCKADSRSSITKAWSAVAVSSQPEALSKPKDSGTGFS